MSASDGAQLNPTIEEILTDEELALLFREFLRQLQCAENLSFFIETEDYKRAQDASVREEKAAKIWAKFLGQNATAPLNIDSKCRQRISERLDSGDLDIFDEASEFVFSMLSLDCYRKFVVSEIYKQWLGTSLDEDLLCTLCPIIY